MDLDLSTELGVVGVSRRQGAVALLIALVTAGLLAVIFSTRLSLVPLSPADVSFVEGQASPVNVLAPDLI